MLDTSSAISCVGISSNMPSTITCNYNTFNRKLTLSNVLSVSSVTNGDSLSFTVSNFKNPYSGVPKTGFTIYTADSNGFSIDSRSSLTVTVSNWASFTQADYDRSDGVTTVNELSQAYVYF
jgi:hypothetical protein